MVSFNIFRSQASSSSPEAGPSTITRTSETMSAANVALPPPPPPAVASMTRSAFRRASEEYTDAFDDFFGVIRTPSERRATRLAMRLSQHNKAGFPAPPSPVLSQTSPPPYSEPTPEDNTELPTYEEMLEDQDEPVTLTRFLYKFGFFFPLFWLAGFFVLLCPLTPADDWESCKSPEVRAAMTKAVRLVEVKWAKRCVRAFAIFLITAALAVLIAFGAMRFT